jgi:AcrR family transcriptional regulator
MTKAPFKKIIGRPPRNSATSHAAVMDTVYQLLQEKPASELTMEEVALRSKVSKPTLYKWWPSKAALIMAMFHERLDRKAEPPRLSTAEETIRAKMRHLIRQFNGPFGKVMGDLVAEGQADPAILNELYERHIKLRRASTVEDIERGKTGGELHPDIDPELLVDMIFGPVYYRLLLRLGSLNEKYGNELVTQAFRNARPSSV